MAMMLAISMNGGVVEMTSVVSGVVGEEKVVVVATIMTMLIDGGVVVELVN